MAVPANKDKWEKKKEERDKTLFSKVLLPVIFFILFFVLVPLYAVNRGNHSLSAGNIVFFYLANLIIATAIFKRFSTKKYYFKYQIQDLEEKINVLNEQISCELRNKFALKEKIRRYESLEKVIEEINKSLTLESVAEHLVSIAFSIVADNKGTCILYLVDNQAHSTLSLFKTKKEDKKLVVKAKEGDIFDMWVLMRTSPLVIENIKKDFRFDLEKTKAIDIRPISSLISVPLISEHKFMGILRLDHPDAYFYSQEDLRLLMTIADLGAVALENGELFKKTQDLAIHDELTSLYTKGYFLERLGEEYKRSLRQNRPLWLLLLDIDYFKNYNDKFGHTAGDIVLKALSQEISGFLGNFSPIISRFGGEEFCVILSGMDRERVGEITEGLRSKIEKMKIILRRQETSITVSIGIAGALDDVSDEDELIIKADKAMYEAKQKGRNRVCGI